MKNRYTDVRVSRVTALHDTAGQIILQFVYIVYDMLNFLCRPLVRCFYLS